MVQRSLQFWPQHNTMCVSKKKVRKDGDVKMTKELYIRPVVSGAMDSLAKDIDRGNCITARDCGTAFGVVGVIVVGGAAILLGAVTDGAAIPAVLAVA